MDPSPASSSQRLYTPTFLLVLLSQSVFVMGNTLMTHHTRWVKALGGTEHDVGKVLSFGAVIGLLVRPWMAQWINRIGARNMWGIGYLVFGGGVLCNIFLHELNWSVYAVRSLFIFGSSIVFASSLTYVTQISPRERRIEAIGIVGAGGFIGMLVGPALGDMLIGSSNPAEGDFFTLFIAAGLFMVLPACLLTLLPPTRLSETPTAVSLKDFLKTVERHWPGMILLVDFTFGLCMTVPFGFLATFIDVEQLVIPGVPVIRLFFWCYAGWGLTVRVTLRKLPDQVGRRRVLLVGMVFMSAGLFSYLLVDSNHPWLIIVPALICGTGHALMFHTMTALTLERFPYEVRGTGSAFSLMTLEAGTVCSGHILGMIAEHSYHTMFLVMGIFVSGATVLYFCSSIPIWKERARMRQEQLES